MDQVTSDNASANRAGNADRGGPACFADSSAQSDFARVFSQEAQTLTCTDSTATTPREEALQKSLPETERNLPPPPSAASVSASGHSSSVAPVNPNLTLATSLVKTGGSGTAEDAQLVAQSLARSEVAFQRVIDKVPGSNTPDKNEVVIAVIGHGTPAGPHVPKTGEGHGCANLVAHEASHSIDQGSPSPSQSDDFTKAREADMNKLSNYEKQAGEAGAQETYAESAARHAEGKDQDTPHLKKYWDDHP